MLAERGTSKELSVRHRYVGAEPKPLATFGPFPSVQAPSELARQCDVGDDNDDNTAKHDDHMDSKEIERIAEIEKRDLLCKVHYCLVLQPGW